MTQSSPKLHPRHYWLTAIAVYKLLQAAIFIAIGVGALHLLRFHIDADDFLADIADRLRFNPEARFVHFLLDKASLVDDPILRRIGAAAFCYAALSLAEGIGLYLEKTWGEILTLLITASFLPWELVELVRRLTWVRVSLFAVNLAVFFYLLGFIYQRKRERQMEQTGKANT
jgi:uncharacterized membrane protein (DUF2068 family)